MSVNATSGTSAAARSSASYFTHIASESKNEVPADGVLPQQPLTFEENCRRQVEEHIKSIAENPTFFCTLPEECKADYRFFYAALSNSLKPDDILRFYESHPLSVILEGWLADSEKREQILPFLDRRISQCALTCLNGSAQIRALIAADKLHPLDPAEAASRLERENRSLGIFPEHDEDPLRGISWLL